MILNKAQKNFRSISSFSRSSCHPIKCNYFTSATLHSKIWILPKFQVSDVMPQELIFKKIFVQQIDKHRIFGVWAQFPKRFVHHCTFFQIPHSSRWSCTCRSQRHSPINTRFTKTNRTWKYINKLNQIPLSSHIKRNNKIKENQIACKSPKPTKTYK